MNTRKPLNVTLRVDSSTLVATLEELSAFPEVADQFFNFLESGLELFRADTKGPAALATGDVWIRLEPSDRLLALLAAARAGHIDG